MELFKGQSLLKILE